MWLFLSFFGKRIGRSDIELSRKYLFRGLDWIVFKSRLDVSPSLFKFPLKTVPLARATLNYNGNARTIILVDSWSFLRHFLLFLFLSREKTQHFDENHFARPIKSTEPWTASPSFQRFPRNGIPSTRYRPSTFPSPSFFFLDLFPTRWGSIKKTEKRERERKEEGGVINEIPCRLIYVDGTSRRIDRAKLRIIEVRWNRERGRIHREWYRWKLSHQLVARRRGGGGSMLWGGM